MDPQKHEKESFEDPPKDEDKQLELISEAVLKAQKMLQSLALEMPQNENSDNFTKNSSDETKASPITEAARPISKQPHSNNRIRKTTSMKPNETRNLGTKLERVAPVIRALNSFADRTSESSHQVNATRNPAPNVGQGRTKSWIGARRTCSRGIEGDAKKSSSTISKSPTLKSIQTKPHQTPRGTSCPSNQRLSSGHPSNSASPETSHQTASAQNSSATIPRVSSTTSKSHASHHSLVSTPPVFTSNPHPPVLTSPSPSTFNPHPPTTTPLSIRHVSRLEKFALGRELRDAAEIQLGENLRKKLRHRRKLQERLSRLKDKPLVTATCQENTSAMSGSSQIDDHHLTTGCAANTRFLEKLSIATNLSRLSVSEGNPINDKSVLKPRKNQPAVGQVESEHEDIIEIASVDRESHAIHFHETVRTSHEQVRKYRHLRELLKKTMADFEANTGDNVTEMVRLQTVIEFVLHQYDPLPDQTVALLKDIQQFKAFTTGNVSESVLWRGKSETIENLRCDSSVDPGLVIRYSDLGQLKHYSHLQIQKRMLTSQNELLPLMTETIKPMVKSFDRNNHDYPKILKVASSLLNYIGVKEPVVIRE